MRILILLFILLASSLTLLTHSQVIISDDESLPDPSAQLEVNSSTHGWLVPRMTSAQRDAISSPAAGLMIYNTETGSIEFFNNSTWVNVNAAANPNKPCGVLKVTHNGITYGTTP